MTSVRQPVGCGPGGQGCQSAEWANPLHSLMLLLTHPRGQWVLGAVRRGKMKPSQATRAHPTTLSGAPVFRIFPAE